MQEREEKKRRKEEAAAAGPKPRGRPPKEKVASLSEVELEKASTVAEKGSPPVKAPLKRRRMKKAGSVAEGAEPSAGSAKKASEPVTQAVAKAEGEVGNGEKDGKGEEAEKPGKVEGKAVGGAVEPKGPSAAQAKRDAKVKLGICKLAEHLGKQDADEMQLPGIGFEGKCWTAVPSGDALVGGCRIRVIPYQDTFYVAGSACLPDYLASVLKVAWHPVVGLNRKC